jgi:hypothetical protein
MALKNIKFEGHSNKNVMKKLFIFVMLLGITLPSFAQSENVLTKGSDDAVEWVDLGLSVKWASCNVGASSPETYGGNYTFPEVFGNYRIPTLAEIWDLVDKCDWKWEEINGHYGCRVTSPMTGQSIFLPAAGMGGPEGMEEVESSGYYWFQVSEEEECYLRFVSDEIFLQTNKKPMLFRYFIRLVSDK